MNGTTPPSYPQSASAAGPSLTDRTFSGFAWALVITLGGKGMSMAAQVILAAMLAPEQFGLVFWAASIGSFVMVLQHAGVREILVHRHRRFALYANAAFWFSLLLGIVTSVMLACAGVGASLFLGRPELASIMAIQAIGCLVASVSIVHQTRMQIDLRHRELSLHALASTVVVTVLSVVMAWFGAGVYALTVPAVFGTTLATVLSVRAAPLAIRSKLQQRRWRYLAGDSARLLGVGVLNNAAGNAANLVLGFGRDPAAVGIFGMASSLSLQTVNVLTLNLAGVVLPALTRLQGEPERILQAFCRACRALTMVGMPLCFLQAAIAGPVIRLLFKPEWEGAVVCVQLLSLGLGFGVLGGVTTSLLKATGRFGSLLGYTAWYSLTNLCFVGVGVYWGGAQSLATAVMIYYLLLNPIGTWWVARGVGGTWGDVRRIFCPPAFMSGVTFGGAYVLGSLLPAGAWADVARICLITSIGATAYWALARVMMPDTVAELGPRVIGVARRLARRRGSAESRQPIGPDVGA